jgi:KDO2-lipid IV(A) lauroyltransferase
VESQLRKCFPDWSEKKHKEVVRLSYLNLADIILESFKSPSMSKEVMLKRYKVVNPELVNDLFRSKQSLLALAGHTANWEWGVIGLNYFLDPRIYGIYKPLANKKINDYLKGIRNAAGTILVPLNLTRKVFEGKMDPPGIIVFVADQSPSNMVDAIWLDFLGQDTACIHGPEKYAEKTGWPVVQFHIYRVKRGYYEVKFSLINQNRPITQQYMSNLEEQIKDRPHEWLWTHKRWKRRREEAEFQKMKRASRASKV